MKRKTRLNRKGTSKKVNRLDKVRDAVVSELRAEDTKTVKNYAKLKDRDVIDNPALALLKAESLNELARRQSVLSEWKSGKIPPISKSEKPKESFIRKLVRGEHKVAGLVGKGFQEYMKVISGGKARELEEGIATIGMKPEEKRKFLETARQKESEAEKKEAEEECAYYPGHETEEEMEKDMPLHAKEAKEFVDHRKALEEGHEPVRAQEPEHIKAKRKGLEDSDAEPSPVKRVPRLLAEKEEGSAPVVINVYAGGKKQSVEASESVAESKEKLVRDEEEDEEDVYDIINEGRAEMAEEQREIEKLKREARNVD
jgi:hypothetical protein